MKRRRASSGFSLLEVLCAILILGVALTGLVEGISTALASNKESELQTSAALIAAGQVETLRAEGMILDQTTTGEPAGALSLYRWTQSITPAGIEGLHEVSVTVEHAKTGKVIYELRTLLFEAPTSPTLDSAARRSRGGRRGTR